MDPTPEKRVSDLFAFGFAIVILAFAASGPMSDFVRWFIETTTPGFDELSRRNQRVLFREHWLGASYTSFERTLLLPTGLVLGLPVVFAFAISFLTLPVRFRWLNWGLASLSALILAIWIVGLFSVDAGALPTAKILDFLLFPIATLLVLYLTWRQFGTFIVGFCIFWIVYFFIRGWLPEWTGILAGSASTFEQSLRSMVLNFWSQTGGMFGKPLQVVSGNVLIFIVFGAVLMASGAGDLLLKIANRLAGGFTGGAAHAAVASSALFGTLSGAAISNVVSTGVMTIPVIKRSGFKPAFAAAVEAAASTGGQIMPPVMGVVAFFVAGQIGLEYRYIVVAAIVPAVFYYVGTFLTVYFEARRLGVGPLPASQRPRLTPADRVQCLVFVLPLGILSYFLFTQPSVPKAGFYGFVVALIASLALFRGFRSWRRVYAAFVSAGRMSASIVVIVAAIGLIVGLIQVSGFTGRLSLLLAQLASGPPADHSDCRRPRLDRPRHGASARRDLFHHRHRSELGHRGSRNCTAYIAPLRCVLRSDIDGHAARCARSLCGRADCRGRSDADRLPGGPVVARRLHHSVRCRLSPGDPLQAAGSFWLVRWEGCQVQRDDRYCDCQLGRPRLDRVGVFLGHVAPFLGADGLRKG